MLRLVARSLGFGLVGLIATPIAVLFIVLVAAHIDLHTNTDGFATIFLPGNPMETDQDLS